MAQSRLPPKEPPMRRVGMYQGHVLVQHGDGKYGAFWTSKKYDTIEDVKRAIDSGEAYNGIYPS